MRLTTGKKRFLMPVLVITLIAGLAGTLTGCEDFASFPTTTTEATAEKTTTEITNTKEGVIMAVYESLLSQAESYEAKRYLADFYATCDNWSAQSAVFKDGSGTWLVTVDMSDNGDWTARTYWQQAGWFVFKDGGVIPANRFQANALRIEADLQELSYQPEEAEG